MAVTQVRDAVTIPQAEWLKQQECISRGSGDWKSKIRVPAWSALFQVADINFPLCPHVAEGTRELSQASFIGLLLSS